MNRERVNVRTSERYSVVVCAKRSHLDIARRMSSLRVYTRVLYTPFHPWDGYTVSPRSLPCLRIGLDLLCM